MFFDQMEHVGPFEHSSMKMSIRPSGCSTFTSGRGSFDDPFPSHSWTRAKTGSQRIIGSQVSSGHNSVVGRLSQDSIKESIKESDETSETSKNSAAVLVAAVQSDVSDECHMALAPPTSPQYARLNGPGRP